MPLLHEREIREMSPEERENKILHLRAKMAAVGSDAPSHRRELMETVRLLERYQARDKYRSDTEDDDTKIESSDIEAGESSGSADPIHILLSDSDLEGDVQSLQDQLELSEDELSRIESAVSESVLNICEMKDVKLDDDLRAATENVVISMILQETAQVS
ncbi:hypothetical protein [Haloarcula sp. JP-L23]|uniref:hypothetical protein n=1 Tax=Haloarcula sp. JP-L23 TaxID=2716717 RepID=UPI00140ED7D2|nr:hypothetical protein G9465_22615 [Haloarcula sp. JP-L23]